MRPLPENSIIMTANTVQFRDQSSSSTGYAEKFIINPKMPYRCTVHNYYASILTNYGI